MEAKSSEVRPPHPILSIDALIPTEMADKAEIVGEAKATMGMLTTFALAVLAGGFIALGAVFSTTVTTGASELPFGIGKLFGGLAFCLGLILVVVAGAELFTGNNLIIMAWADKHITTAQLLRNWAIVYVGNFVGSINIVIFIILSRQYTFSNGAIGLNMLKIANAKCSLGFIQAVTMGLMCNVLVCLAVWLCFSARSTTDKILSIIFPITAFVAAGFEHSVANMYFIPVGLLLKAWAPTSFWEMVGTSAADFANLTWGNFLVGNLIPVTIGNILGGSVMVGLVYWFIYIRKPGKLRD